MRYPTLLLLALLTLACQHQPTNAVDVAAADTSIKAVTASTLPTVKEVAPPTFASPYFNPALADGFDFPIGTPDATGSYTDNATGTTHNGWYIAAETAESYSLGIHTGEDWNGKGGGNTDLGQPVYCAAKGIVLAADDYFSPWGNIVLVEHHYLENGTLKSIRSLYAHLDEITVAVGDTLERRQQLGTIGTGNGAYPAHLHFELRTPALYDQPVDFWPSAEGHDASWVLKHYAAPSDFINTHRTLTVPASLPSVAIASKGSYKMHHYAHGTLLGTYDIALGQNGKGHKEQQGDNRTPEGEYTIIQKSTGPFPGAMGPWFGSAWMRLNYPNAYDARAGLAAGKISQSECNRIEAAIRAGKEPTKATKLGGGIGIHGWSGEWTPMKGYQDLTWGCISINNEPLLEFYEAAPLGTVVLILPD